LRQPADEKNSARESDDLNDGLDERVITDPTSMIERATEDWR